jgi:hypothetical protein
MGTDCLGVPVIDYLLMLTKYRCDDAWKMYMLEMKFWWVVFVLLSLLL